MSLAATRQSPISSFVAALLLRLSFEAEICKAVSAVQRQTLQSDYLVLGLNLILRDHHPGYKLSVLLQTMSMSVHGTQACLINGYEQLARFGLLPQISENRAESLSMQKNQWLFRHTPCKCIMQSNKGNNSTRSIVCSLPSAFSLWTRSMVQEIRSLLLSWFWCLR